MIKQITQFKCEVQGFESIFYFDSNCVTSAAKEALALCLDWVEQIEAHAKDEAQKKNEESQNEVVNDEQHCTV